MIYDKMKSIKTRIEIPALLKQHGLNNKICEIGVRFGYHFQQLLTCNPRMAIAIDHYAKTKNPAEQDTNIGQEELAGIYCDVFKRFADEPAVRIIRESSLKASNFFPLFYFDYVYIDADHSYEGCLRDIRLWWGKVRQGGVLAGHDYIDKKSQNGVDFGVIRAVADFMAEKNIDKKFLHHTEEGYRTWLLYKEDGE